MIGMKIKNKTLALTESSVMLALAFILSMIKVVDMPYGGSVTAFSMLPIIIIAYRYRSLWGLTAGLTFSLLKMLMGLNSLSYATSAAAAVAIIVLDYIAAFTLLGLGGIFRGTIKNQPIAMASGALLVSVIRYVCHIISGCTVWAGVSIPSSDGLIYSIGYNGTYMIPEILMTVAGAYFVGQIFTLTDDKIVRRPASQGSLSGVLAAMPIVLAAVISSAFVFRMMQNPNDGSFDISLVATQDFLSWLPVIIIVAIGAAASLSIMAAFRIKAGRKNK